MYNTFQVFFLCEGQRWLCYLEFVIRVSEHALPKSRITAEPKGRD